VIGQGRTKGLEVNKSSVDRNGLRPCPIKIIKNIFKTAMGFLVRTGTRKLQDLLRQGWQNKKKVPEKRVSTP